MKQLCFRSIILCSILYITSVGANARPLTIPGVKEHSVSEGHFYFSQSSRIVLKHHTSPKLSSLAETFKKDLFHLTGISVQITSSPAKTGDIVLKITDSDILPSNEGYFLTIAEKIEISGPESQGVFYGTRTLLQLLKQNRLIPAGQIVDWPCYPERGLMIDLGRKFFPVGWIKRHIVELSYFKLNMLHLHFSDDLGFRLESHSHPLITSYPFYSREEIEELISFAQEYYITIIPEIDLPGHTGWLKWSYPELILGHNGSGIYYMDISQQKAYDLTEALLEEFLPLFPGPYWHTGADEFIGAANYHLYPQLERFAQERYGQQATGIDAFVGYVNWIDSIVNVHGKTLRSWADAYEYDAINSNSAVSLNRTVIQELWNAYQHPEEVLNAGFKIQNSSFRPTYYNLGAYKGDAALLYEKWAPNKYFGGWPRENWDYPITISAEEPNLLGAKLSIWCDYPESETVDEVAEGIKDRLRAFAHNSWGAEKLKNPYEEFTFLIDLIGRAPGFDDENTVTTPTRSPGMKTAAIFFENSTTLRLKTPKPGNFTLRVYSVNGRKIDEIYFPNLSAGTHYLKWHNEALSPGVYLIEISGNMERILHRTKFLR
ncbi:beta-N-acetylhexosaminidase [Chitinispirillum alkaliphilum]|nr:beta-N-acetylhexosaminidase [Chitinispirillum alkaliphilum]